jgi:hypothetical protein
MGKSTHLSGGVLVDWAPEVQERLLGATYSADHLRDQCSFHKLFHTYRVLPGDAR